MSASYDATHTDERSSGRHLPDGVVVAIAIALVVGVRWQPSATAVVLAAGGLGCLLVVRRGAAGSGPFEAPRKGGALAVLALGAALGCGGVRGHTAVSQLEPRALGSYVGWAEVVADPVPSGPGLRVTLELSGQRFDAWVYGSARRRLLPRQAGQSVWIVAERSRLTPQQRTSYAISRNIVGRLDVERVVDWWEGGAITRANTRIRSSIRHVSEQHMSAERAALFSGLVIGDDARQPPAMVDAFRASGLSHLTAVSGQNVAYVVAGASPLVNRLRPGWRWAATIGIIAWFMALTRFEPSVLRAGVMAAIAASAFAVGRQASTIRSLALTIAALVVWQPLITWSVGFWLSVGATAGMALLAPALSRALPGPAWLRLPFALTFAAQVGVALPSVVIFGRLPLTSLVCNLLAGPVAGAVMLVGLPAALVASLVPAVAGPLMWPTSIGVAWVDTAARLGARAEPPPVVNAVGWLIIGLVTVGWCLHGRASSPPEPEWTVPSLP